MPAYKFICDACDDVTPRTLDKRASELTPEDRKCRSCGNIFTRRVPPSTSVSVYEKLDNGLMPRAVERFKDAEEKSKERAENDPRNKS